MLKGSIFDNQLYTDDACATINNTFLNHKSGIISDYGEAFNVTTSGSNLIVHTGMAVIQGRAVYENVTTTIEASTSVGYARLVIELDMSQTNTEDACNQVSYKILTADSSYPSLTQNDLFTNQTGKYQFSLGRFQTSSTGISNYTDERTYIDWTGIYNEVENHIKAIDSTSAMVMKSEIVDNLVSTSTTAPLSANQGNVIHNALNSINNEILNLNTEVDIKQPVVLYSSTGGSTSNITLSDSAANYNYIEIYFIGHNNCYCFTKVFSPNGKKVNLNNIFIDGNSAQIYINYTVAYINGKTITVTEDTPRASFITPTAVTFYNTNENSIVRVIGYK